MTLIERPHL